jgi:uncharacterized surface protein with fasciclin (FAS1) repeats
MNALLRRGGGVAAAAVLTVGLAACGSSSPSNSNDAMSNSPSPSASANAGAQTFGPACGAIPKVGAGSFNGMVSDPVATAASNNPLLSTLVAAVTKAGLVSTLNSAQGLTVFAPYNPAFAKFPKATLASVLANKKELTSILTHHVIAGQLDPNQVIGTHKTLNGDSVTVAGSTSAMTVDGAKVLCGNIPTANATVYVIDTVLMPAKK